MISYLISEILLTPFGWIILWIRYRNKKEVLKAKEEYGGYANVFRSSLLTLILVLFGIVLFGMILMGLFALIKEFL